jgi:putative transposase
VTIKTTSGPLTLERPKLRGTDQRFASALLGAQVTRSNALEALVIAGFVRGLSTRDVEATLAEALGAQAALSRSTVSRICQQISTEFAAWSTPSLAEVELDYLYLDGTCFRYHPGARAEPVLVAYGITTGGSPVFLGLAPAASEGHDPWVDFLGDLSARGLRPPLLVITDGAPGLLSAVEQAFPAALRQRCLVHRLRNLLAKVPTGAQAEVKAAYWAIFDDLDQPPGQAVVNEATRRAEAFATRYEHLYPSAVACLISTLSELTTHLRFPAEHRQRIRHTDESFKARVCCRPAGTGLASWSGVVDPGAKSRVVGLEALPRSLPLEGPNRRGPSGGGHAPCDQIVIGACSQAASVASPPPAGGKRPRPAR